MDEYFADKLTEIQDTEDTAYLLENNEIFYDVGYKVMQNQENANLLRCHRIKYNGKIKLIYFTREYTSLEDYIASSQICHSFHKENLSRRICGRTVHFLFP